MAVDLKSMSDEEVVRLFREGREDAFDELYNRYHEKLRRVIYYYLGDAEDSEDVFHDVFFRVFKHIGSYRDDRPFTSWIYQIAVNCSKNHRKKSVRNDILFEREKDEFRAASMESVTGLSPEDTYIRDTELKEFYRAVGGLKDKFRTVFLMRHDQGLRYGEISKILKCSERTVKWRMKRALELIADDLKDRGII
ncbi:MAG: RNA polymerase sigma factor [Spirochaetes bacterium]|nr:RNA polymerase sigma factor [Spirochaetota bacterium]HPA72214.1 RNA polymerase sigma factor [Spirochaetota bacterium]